MRLSEVIRDVEVTTFSGDRDTDITDIFYDSRLVRAGGLFFAYRGRRNDGHKFIAEAVGRGAAALVVEDAGRAPGGVPVVVVTDGRLALALAAARFWGFPSASLYTVGITGTDGKTTTAWLLRHLLDRAAMEAALFSTVGAFVGGRKSRADLTTAEAPDLQRALRAAADGGARAAVIECSSHGLALERLTGTEFDVAVFTNLSHDHLDFHGDAEGYFRVKARLFEMLKPGGVAVVNIDDAYGWRLAGELSGPVISYSCGRRADFSFDVPERGRSGISFRLRGPGGDLTVDLPFGGVYNAYNASAAVAAAHALGADWEAAAAALAGVPPVPGRLETITAGGLTVVIDYAHAPNAMENVLEEIRLSYPGTYLVVAFGCPGDRDRKKRPVMGALAARFGDFTVVTNDDPFYEDPAVIAAEVVAGIPPGTDYAVELDRAKAVEVAVERAARRTPAVVALLGKGHEEVQKVRGEAVPYNDRRVVLAVLGLSDPDG